MLKKAVFAVTLSVILIISGLFWWASRPVNNLEEVDTSDQQIVDVRPAAVRVEARWLMTGEVFWGRQMEIIAERQDDPHAYLFSQLKTFDKDKYDAWTAQLECPIANKTIPYSVQVESLIFNCDPSYLAEFAKWFDAVSLANNHMDNAGGLTGLEESRENLEEHGVQYYGHYDNSVLADNCEVISLPVRVIYDDDSEQTAQLPVAMCGYHGVYRLPTEAELDVIKDYSPWFLTITSPHQGAEYQSEADELKIQIYRGMVDRGADLVVASHPHWVQNSEVYKNKLIMYSVGNFMFDQEWSEEVKRGVVLDISLSVPYDQTLQSWLDLAEDCAQFKDDCLMSARALKLKKPNYKLVFDLISSYHSEGLTKKASDKVHQINLATTDWQQTLDDLGQND